MMHVCDKAPARARPLMDGTPRVQAPIPPGLQLPGVGAPGAGHRAGWHVPLPVNTESMTPTSLTKHKWSLLIRAGWPEEAGPAGVTAEPLRCRVFRRSGLKCLIGRAFAKGLARKDSSVTPESSRVNRQAGCWAPWHGGPSAPYLPAALHSVKDWSHPRLSRPQAALATTPASIPAQSAAGFLRDKDDKLNLLADTKALPVPCCHRD